MASIATIVRNARGTAGNWHVAGFGSDHVALYHYSTRMLVWNPLTREVAYGAIGWGSVSDQQGMNKAFAEIDPRYKYRRNGHPRVEYMGEPITGLSTEPMALVA